MLHCQVKGLLFCKAKFLPTFLSIKCTFEMQILKGSYNLCNVCHVCNVCIVCNVVMFACMCVFVCDYVRL